MTLEPSLLPAVALAVLPAVSLAAAEAPTTEQLVATLTSGERTAASDIANELERLGFVPLPGLESLQVPFEFEAGDGETREGRNVIGYLPASDPGPGRSEPVVLVGADDDVSAVAAVLLAAREILASPRRHPVALAFWSGEEQSPVGSGAFLEGALVAPGNVLAYLDLDGVGWVRKNRIDVHGVGSSPAWRGLIERANVPVGFDLRLHDEPSPSTDAASFHLAQVPAVTLTTASYEDRNRPGDRPEELDTEELERVARLGALLVRKLDGLEARPDFVAARSDEDQQDHPEDRRAYTGTIPDYAAEVDGLRLSGVIEGGPAAKAGLVEGDVVVEFAGQSISNIYDYGDALDAVELNQPIQVVFIRGEERYEVTITPTGRP